MGKKKELKEKQVRVSYYRKPEKMSTRDWQIALRRQFAEKNPFAVKNLNGQPVFSDYKVYNPTTGNTYKVALRSKEPGANFCSCMDFKTNDLGTCKHVEAVFHHINENKQLARLLDKGFTANYLSLIHI